MKTNLFIYKSLITNYYWDKNNKYLIYFVFLGLKKEVILELKFFNLEFECGIKRSNEGDVVYCLVLKYAT